MRECYSRDGPKVAALVYNSPLVSICIPAYKGQRFIGETIQSALSQTIDDIEIVISNDGGHSTPALETFAAHPRIKIYASNVRRGWVQNSNYVLSLARGKYFMILPHDDLLQPDYLESCLDILERDRGVFAAYSDIASDQGLLPATEVVGPVTERLSHVMRHLYNGYSFRAVMPRHPELWDHLRLRSNPPADFCVDTTWILQQACLGELRKVPRPLYWKRLHAGSTHATWENLPSDVLLAAWQQHCLQMGEIAKKWVDDPAMIADLVSQRIEGLNLAELPPYLATAIANKPKLTPGRLPVT